MVLQWTCNDHTTFCKWQARANRAYQNQMDVEFLIINDAIIVRYHDQWHQYPSM